MDWRITPGQAADITQAQALLRGKSAVTVLADKAYDADALLDFIQAQGAQAVITPRQNRIEQRPYDSERYKERNQVERFFNKLKQCRHIATRYDKTDRNFLAWIALASSLLWLA